MTTSGKSAGQQKFDRNQHCLTGARSFEEENPKQGPSNTEILSVRDGTIIAELRWVLKCVVSDYSIKSCKGIGEFFACIFGASAEDFSLSRTMVRYLITDVLGLYFKKKLLEDIKDATFTLNYNVTTNSANEKVLHVNVIYWSERTCQIENKHLESFFISSDNERVLVEKINLAINNASLSHTKLLMLEGEDYFVNDAVEDLINDKLMSLENKPLLNMRSCNIQLLHEAFSTGLQVFGKDASELIFKIYGFIEVKNWRRKDYEIVKLEVGVSSHSFLKMEMTRELTIEEPARRIIGQWSALQEYFKVFIPRQRRSLMKDKYYEDILNLLNKEDMMAQLKFVCVSAQLFKKFRRVFQTSQPMIHELYDNLLQLENTLKRDPINVVSHDSNADFSTELSKLDEKTRSRFLVQAKKHFTKAGAFVGSKIHLPSSIIKHCCCLKPSERNSSQSLDDITALARALTINVDINLIQDEWRLLQQEKEVVTEVRIDAYWAHFFKLKNDRRELRYPTLATIIKSALALSYGSFERGGGFTDSFRFLIDDEVSKSERLLNSIRYVKSGMKEYHMKPQCVEITKELVDMTRFAHAKYKIYPKKKSGRKEEQIQKQKYEEGEVEEEEQEEQQQQQTIMLKKSENISKNGHNLNNTNKRKREDKFLFEAVKSLKLATERNDMSEVEFALVMLEGMKKLRK